jgi:hypothetical protein
MFGETTTATPRQEGHPPKALGQRPVAQSSTTTTTGHAQAPSGSATHAHAPSGSSGTNAHAVVDHDAWRGRFGLEVQAPFAQLLLDGHKSIETRRYALPQALLGKWIDILETPDSGLSGAEGRSGLPDAFVCHGDTDGSIARIMGMVKFRECTPYKDKETWDRDRYRHVRFLFSVLCSVLFRFGSVSVRLCFGFCFVLFC